MCGACHSVAVVARCSSRRCVARVLVSSLSTSMYLHTISNFKFDTTDVLSMTDSNFKFSNDVILALFRFKFQNILANV